MVHESPNDTSSLQRSKGKIATPGRCVIATASFAWFGSVLFTALISFVCAELTARLYWRVCCSVSLLKPWEILYAYYPELQASGELPEVFRPVFPKQATRGDRFYNILLLGGAVLHKSWGSVEVELREQRIGQGEKGCSGLWRRVVIFPRGLRPLLVV
jgi:hypothetical protein